MLAEIITQVSGMPWQDYIRDNLFLPAEMTHSYLTDFNLIIPNRANGYMYIHNSLVNSKPMYAIRPSGGFLSTSSDMIKWAKVMA